MTLSARDNLPQLVVRSGKGEETYPLSRQVTTIGRLEGSDVEIDDLSSSRRHCQIIRDNGRWELVDLDSRNGTLVNGVIVSKKQLADGDLIEIGRTRLYFRDKAAQEQTPQPLPGPEISGRLSFGPEAEKLGGEAGLQAAFFRRLLQAVKVIHTKKTVKEVLGTLLQNVLELTRFEHGLILLRSRNGGKFSLSSFRKLDPESAARESEVVVRAFGSAAAPVEKSFACEEFDCERWDASLRALAVISPRSFACMPVRLKTETLGLVYVDSHEKGCKVEGSPLRGAEVLVDQAAVAITNTRLLEEERRRVRKLEEAKSKAEREASQLRKETVNRASTLPDAVRAAEKAESPPLKHDYHEIITASPKVYQALEVVDRVVESDASVLIKGESGTGKELIARAVHYNSPRADHRFVSENCSAIPENLFESEFFGYERGAFTGADHSKPGLFEVADGGTLFLDEIGDIPLIMQGKFLRVLQDGELRRVGGERSVKVDVRIVSATNRNLEEMIKAGRFREDLYYRLNVVGVRLPPLRERKEDIPLLVHHFLKTLALRNGAKIKEITPEALRIFREYSWPGNVRELQNELERLVVLSREKITAGLIGEGIRQEVEEKCPSENRPLQEIVQRAIGEVEEDVIETTLNEQNWKKTKVASILGISRPTLDNKIAKYRLSRGSRSGKKQS